MDAVEKIARTCLYEGYLLWPYRRSALKNTKRWTFGGVYPHSRCAALGEPGRMRTEVLLAGDAGARIEVRVRFLHVVHRQVFRCGPAGPEPTDSLTVAGARHLTWHEATEREWVLPPWSPADGRRATAVAVQGGTAEERLCDDTGCQEGALVRSWQPLTGIVELAAAPVARGATLLTVTVTNTTACPPPSHDPRGARDELAEYAFVSTHTVLHSEDAAFVSLIDPPVELREAAAMCRNEGTWPVLVGDLADAAAPRDPHRARTVLSSPVTLYDYPAVAPESPGDLFDGGEIDKLLILGVLSLTPEEQLEARATDPKAREILDRCAALSPAELMALHGTIRDSRPLLEDA
jgi:hypothetical protein